MKLCSPDYKDTDVDAAIADFQARIKNYELAYESLDTIDDKYGAHTVHNIHVHVQYVYTINVLYIYIP